MHPVVEGCNALKRVEDAECAEYEREGASSVRQRKLLTQTRYASQSCGLLSELGEGKREACHCYVSIGLEGVVSQTEEGSAVELEDSALAAPQIQLELVSSHFDQERVELEGVASREGDSLDCVLICHAEQLPVEPLLFRNRGVAVVFVEEVVVEDGEVGARALMTDDPSLHHHCIPHKGIPSDDEAPTEGPTRGEKPRVESREETEGGPTHNACVVLELVVSNESKGTMVLALELYDNWAFGASIVGDVVRDELS